MMEVRKNNFSMTCLRLFIFHSGVFTTVATVSFSSLALWGGYWGEILKLEMHWCAHCVPSGGMIRRLRVQRVSCRSLIKNTLAR